MMEPNPESFQIPLGFPLHSLMNPQDGNFFPCPALICWIPKTICWGEVGKGREGKLFVWVLEVFLLLVFGGVFLVGIAICLPSISVNHKSPVFHPNMTWIQLLDSNAELTTWTDGWNPYCPKPTQPGTDFGMNAIGLQCRFSCREEKKASFLTDCRAFSWSPLHPLRSISSAEWNHVHGHICLYNA